MNKEELIKRRFKEHSWQDDGEMFTEFVLETPNCHIEILGIDTVSIKTNREWVDVPNCRTIKDLDDLIRLFV